MSITYTTDHQADGLPAKRLPVMSSTAKARQAKGLPVVTTKPLASMPVRETTTAGHPLPVFGPKRPYPMPAKPLPLTTAKRGACQCHSCLAVGKGQGKAVTKSMDFDPLANIITGKAWKWNESAGKWTLADRVTIPETVEDWALWLAKEQFMSAKRFALRHKWSGYNSDNLPTVIPGKADYVRPAKAKPAKPAESAWQSLAVILPASQGNVTSGHALAQWERPSLVGDPSSVVKEARHWVAWQTPSGMVRYSLPSSYLRPDVVAVMSTGKAKGSGSHSSSVKVTDALGNVTYVSANDGTKALKSKPRQAGQAKPSRKAKATAKAKAKAVTRQAKGLPLASLPVASLFADHFADWDALPMD